MNKSQGFFCKRIFFLSLLWAFVRQVPLVHSRITMETLLLENWWSHFIDGNNFQNYFLGLFVSHHKSVLKFQSFVALLLTFVTFQLQHQAQMETLKLLQRRCCSTLLVALGLGLMLNLEFVSNKELTTFIFKRSVVFLRVNQFTFP